MRTEKADIQHCQRSMSRELNVDDSWYRRLRLVQLVVPVTATAYFVLAAIADWSSIEVLATTTVISTVVGCVVKVSENDYDKSDAKYDGDMVVFEDEEGNILYTLELNRDAGEFKKDKSIRFKVVNTLSQE